MLGEQKKPINMIFFVHFFTYRWSREGISHCYYFTIIELFHGIVLHYKVQGFDSHAKISLDESRIFSCCIMFLLLQLQSLLVARDSYKQWHRMSLTVPQEKLKAFALALLQIQCAPSDPPLWVSTLMDCAFGWVHFNSTRCCHSVLKKLVLQGN